MSTVSLAHLEIMRVPLCKRWWEVFHLAVGDEHDRNKQVEHCVCSLKSTLFPGHLFNHFCRLQAIKNWMVGRPGNEATISWHHPTVARTIVEIWYFLFCMGEACGHEMKRYGTCCHCNNKQDLYSISGV